MRQNIQFILASASPRRAELLRGVGAQFDVETSDVDEDAFDAARYNPAELVLALASAKCAAVAARHPDVPVVAADTVVYLNGEILGKPSDEADARRMLARLSGGRHTVYTGVAVRLGANEYRDYQATDVYFRELSDGEIERYAASGEPLDKAGAYGIQCLGALLVERVDGDYFNVVGMPLVKTAQLLARVGITLL